MNEASRIPADAQRRAVEVEQIIIGAVITRGSKPFAAAVAAGLGERDFASIEHSTVWSAFCEAVAIGDRPNGSTAFRAIKSASLGAYWSKLATSGQYGGDFDIPYLVDQIIDERRRREAWMEAVGVLEDLKNGALPARPMIERHITKLQDTIARDTRGGVRSIGDVVEEVVARADAAGRGEAAPLGLKTGFEAIDEFLGGMEPGSMTVLGARPSMGKTALACSISLNAAKEGKRVAFFSLEMTRDEMALRFLSIETRIPMHAIKSGRLTPSDWAEKIHNASATIRGLPIEVDDRPGLRMTEIEATARTLGKGLGLIVIDHLGLVGAPEDARSAGIVERTAAVSNACKRLAKSLGAPVLALAQLSRANEQRDEKRPVLSDLRWSGEIEQDADVVMFLHRPEYYVRQRDGADSEIAEVAGKAEAIVAKNRNGSTGTAHLRFESRAARFCNLTERMP